MQYTLPNHHLKPFFMQENNPSLPMGKPTLILRRSIFSFLKNYDYFTLTPALLALPFAIASLVSQSLVSQSYLFPFVHARMTSLFLASGIVPPSSELFTLLNLKLSQTILTSLFVSPFTYSFLVFAKASVIRAFHDQKQPQELPISSWISLFNPIFTTQLCNSLLILTANSTCFFFLSLCFTFFDVLGLSSPPSLLLLLAFGAIVYSIILANAYIICSLASVSSGMEKQGGFIAILKACVLIQGRTATALSLAVPINLALVAIEALFEYRIIRAYNRGIDPISAIMLLEGILIAYLYSLLLVLDTIIGCLFWRSCKTDQELDHHDEMHHHWIEIEERDSKLCAGSKMLP